MSDPSDDPISDHEHISEVTGRLRRGERPERVDQADRPPEMAGRIREVFPILLEMEPSGSALGPETCPFSPGADRLATAPRCLANIG
jgi:hypothetical protein